MAKKSTATIAVSVIARTKGFFASLKRVRRRIRRFAKAVERSTRGLRNLARIGTVSFGLLSAGIGFLIRNIFKLNDSLAKTADTLGITTESLASLQLAGEFAGVSIEQTRKGLETMAKNVGQAATGTGEAKQALEELGLDALKLSRMKIDRMFLAISEALTRVRDRSKQIFIVRTIFGRAGGGFLRLAAMGREALAKTADFAVKSGIAIDRGTARLFENANDAITRLISAIKGALTEAAAVLAPVITRISDLITNKIIGRKPGAIKRFIQKIVLFAIDAVRRFINFLLKIPVTVERIKVSLLDMFVGIKEGLPFTSPTQKDIERLKQARKQLRESKQTAARRIGAVNDFSRALTLSLSGVAEKGFGGLMKSVADIFKKPIDFGALAGGPTKAMTEAIKKKLSVLRTLGGILVDEFVTGFKKAAQKTKRATAASIASFGQLRPAFASEFGLRATGRAKAPPIIASGKIEFQQLHELKEQTTLLQKLNNTVSGIIGLG
jgi:hypothetical protein